MTQTADPTPAVSVVIPAWNAAWCVSRAIDSVLAQGLRDVELIVVDDGSSDGTPQVLARYGNAIRVLRQPNRGLAAARNAGIRAARAPLVAFLDADDWWLPGKLQQQVALMRAQPALGFCSTAARVEDPAGRLLNLWSAPRWSGSFLVHLFGETAAVAGSGSAVLARRALLEEVGGFDETLRSLEDTDLWMRLAARAAYACLDEPLVGILKRPDSMSRNLETMRTATLRVLRKNRRLLPRELHGRYWRRCMAAIHGDYAKWRHRQGQRWRAATEVAQLLALAPLAKGRLGLGLLRDILLGRPL